MPLLMPSLLPAGEHDQSSFWATQMIAGTKLRYNQREIHLVRETQLLALSQLFKMPSIVDG